MTTTAARPSRGSSSSADGALLSAYRGVRQATPPVWFMRQAGRSLPEYHEVRAGHSMLDSCLEPELAAEITLQPVRRHGVDAAIFFSDIVIPLKLAGVGVEIVAGRGPVFANPVRTAAEVAALPTLTVEDLAPVAAGVARTVDGLKAIGDGTTPLIGFAGAPFTLAAYLVEGGPSKEHLAARTLMHSDPDAWAALMAWAADASGLFLRAQVLAGASAVQLFDSWAGSLSLSDYVTHVAPASARALSHVADLEIELTGDPARPGETQRVPVPKVHFGVGTGELLPAMRDVGADVVGVDWRLPLDEAVRRLGGAVPVQGNIDPALLAAPWPVLEAHIRDVIARGTAAPAHVLNLGHGVPPETDPGVLTRIVDFVHGLDAP